MGKGPTVFAAGAGWGCLEFLIQSNLNGLNTFGTMKICSRQGKFEPMSVDYRARSRSIIWSSFRFL